MVVKVTEKNIQREVYSCRQPVLVEFYEPWCPKCAMMEDVLRDFSETHREIKVCQINAGREIQLTDQYGIEKVPAFVAFRGGRPVGVVVGAVSSRILLELCSADGSSDTKYNLSMAENGNYSAMHLGFSQLTLLYRRLRG